MVIEPTLKTCKLDLGSGPWPKEGFEGVDRLAFNGTVKHVMDFEAPGPWPWPDESIAEANASHVLEHLGANGRIHFVNQLHRVLIPGGTCRIQSPHWASSRAYGDLTHKWPPISEEWFPYLQRQWRSMFAPHTDGPYSANNHAYYSCDFDVTWTPVFRADTAVRHHEYQQFAASHYKDVIADIAAVFTKR